MKKLWKYLLCIAILGMTACNEKNDEPTPPPADIPIDFLPEFDYAIAEWNGEKATDAALDIPGNDAGIYYEANTFSHKVTITYDGANAIVESSNSNIISHIEGAYVTIDMLTNLVSNVEIILQGETTDGALKVYGKSKYKLTLNGVNIESQRGAAINNQCKKAVFVHIADGTTNTLTDAQEYTDDTYYINPSAEEDRKACFFSEGNMLFSGTGILKIASRYNHALATDDFLNIRPGVTLVITEAAKNCIQVKGDAKANLGINIMGGLIYANIASTAGKAIKCDLGVNILGGQLLLNVSGNSEYDSAENDTSSAACIKTDTNLSISGGKHTLKSTGTGGKGINTDGTITINGGETSVSTSGSEYIYSSTLSSSPKAIKADGNITINSGTFNISASSNSDGAEGLDCGGTLFINGGETFVHAYDDAVKVSTDIAISGGKIYAYSQTKDGIDTNGSFIISDGTAVGIGSGNRRSGINASESSQFIINGGNVISLGGMLQVQSPTSLQDGTTCKNITAKAGETLSIVADSDKQTILSLQLPRDINKEVILFSTPKVSKTNTYTPQTSTSTTDTWCGIDTY